MAKHEGKGGLWHNNYKVDGDKRPDYVGEITIHGVTHKISGWVNHTIRKGAPIINLVFNEEYIKPVPATEPRDVGATTMAVPVEFDPFDDDSKIPF